jgi:hypothetical protein
MLSAEFHSALHNQQPILRLNPTPVALRVSIRICDRVSCGVPNHRRWTSIGSAVVCAISIAGAGCGFEETNGVASEHDVRKALLAELQPVVLQNCTLGRFGGSNDSGLLVCKNLLEEADAAYSFVSLGKDEWAPEISARYSLPVHQYDSLDSLTNHVASSGDRGRRLAVRIDVEGKEWDPLMEAPREVLAQIDQLAVEFHGVNERRFLDVIRRLKQTFYIVNVYFNNNACSSDLEPLPAWAYQVLFVSRRIGLLDPSATGHQLPSPLNAPDNPGLPDCQPEIPDRDGRQRHQRQQLLDELRPVALRNCTLARFGSENDGGYLMCENLIKGLQTAYSYGVGKNDDWGCDVSTRYGVPVHQYDCFDPARPACDTGKFVFHDECIGDHKERVEARIFDTLANQIETNGDTGKSMIVKIDIEGAEWDALMATPDALLEQIDQMPMELHGVDDERFVKVLRKLKRTFYLVNLHFNNLSCSTKLSPFPGWAYQVLFVNKWLGVVDRSRGTPPPSPLNAPDEPGLRDCQVEFTAR